MSGRPGSCHYLLFAGSHRTGGGLQDLAGVFDAEPDARAAFTGLRTGADVDWAELAAVEAGGRVRVLCWFGHLRPEPLSAHRPVTAGNGQRAIRLRWYRAGRVQRTQPAEGLGAR